jgi:hypothetical protein
VLLTVRIQGLVHMQGNKFYPHFMTFLSNEMEVRKTASSAGTMQTV